MKVATRLRSVTPDEIELRMVSHAQRLVNAATRQVLNYTPFTVEPRRVIYDVVNLIPDYVRVIAVRDEGRDLDYMKDWQELCAVDRHWLGRISSSLLAFAPIGRELLCLWPGILVAHEVEVVSIKVLRAVTADTDALELPDKALPLVVDLTEALMHLRERRYNVSSALSSVAKQGQPTIAGPAWEALQRFIKAVPEVRRV